MTDHHPTGEYVAAALDQLADLADAIEHGPFTANGQRIPLSLAELDRLGQTLGTLALRVMQLGFNRADPTGRDRITVG